jgi:hypothetical protein
MPKLIADPSHVSYVVKLPRNVVQKPEFDGAHQGVCIAIKNEMRLTFGLGPDEVHVDILDKNELMAQRRRRAREAAER